MAAIVANLKQIYFLVSGKHRREMMEPTMSTKRILAISLLLPLMAISATAHAGSTITDKSYWPSEVRQSAQNAPAGSRSDFTSAFAYGGPVSSLQLAANASDGGSTWRYEGGPKGR